jgi:hypothetical protein
MAVLLQALRVGASTPEEILIPGKMSPKMPMMADAGTFQPRLELQEKELYVPKSQFARRVRISLNSPGG